MKLLKIEKAVPAIDTQKIHHQFIMKPQRRCSLQIPLLITILFISAGLCLSPFFPSGLFFKLALPNFLEVSRSYGVFPEVFRTPQGIDLLN